jgi:Ca2+-binding RTX toxin-like protein
VTSQNPTTLAPPNPTAGDNTLTDPTFSDYNFFYGGQGNDTLTGGGASETFLGGTGVDSMTGAAGNDTYYVDDARDLTIEYAGVVGGWDSVYTSVTYTLAANVEAIVLTGTAINATGNVDHNYLVGNGANNTLDGQGGADDMVGRAGNDTYIVDNAGDTVTENVGEGRDAVCAYIHYALGNNVEDLWLYGTTNLNGYGNALNNYLVGNSGNNKLDGQGGADVMSGGLGDDIYVVENAGDVVTETTAVGGGWDGVYSSVSYSLGANVEALVLTGTAGIGGYGNADHNYIVGNDMGNILDGRGGADDMAGGLGGDIYYVDNALDTTTESVNAGWDSVYSSTLSYTLSVNVEALVLLEGSAATTAIGNTAYNYMVGNSAANIFDGKGGGDFMVGGNGNDTYTVYNSNDTIVEYANEGWDVVWSSGSYALSANVDSLWLSGTANVNAYGNGDYNYLVGNNGNNLLDGQGGNDLIFGGEGADIFVGSLGRDVYNLTETTAATDTIRVATGDSLAVSGNYDFATGFKLGTGTVSTTGVDQLDLVSTLIAGNTAATNGINAGAIMSHSITNGIINFATSDTFAAAPLTLSDGYLDNVFSYLQANIAGSQTVGFVCSGNSYVFQDGGVTDTLVELVGVVATSLNNTGLAANSVWIV